jgi:hypothetical protein
MDQKAFTQLRPGLGARRDDRPEKARRVFEEAEQKERVALERARRAAAELVAAHDTEARSPSRSHRAVNLTPWQASSSVLSPSKRR